MSTSIRPALHAARRDFRDQTASVKVHEALLACGILYALLHPIVNDVIAAAM